MSNNYEQSIGLANVCFTACTGSGFWKQNDVLSFMKMMTLKCNKNHRLFYFLLTEPLHLTNLILIKIPSDLQPKRLSCLHII